MSRNVWFICFLAFCCILAACGSSSTHDVHTDQIRLSDGRSFNFSLEIPTSWDGKYTVQQTGSSAAFEYTAVPKTPLFTLTALTDAEWAEIQDDPGVIQVMTQVEAVFVYTIALENLYSGSQAEEFQQMAGDVQTIINSLTVTAVK